MKNGKSIALRLWVLAALAAAASSQPTVAAAAGADQSSALEEVVVTVRKRSESLIEVPESITAFGAATLQDYNIQSFADYATKVPNLGVAVGQAGLGVTNATSIAIRGISGSGTTAFYIDDTPVPISVDPRVVDIDRVEVLKGPQGTLYGASSMGGNVRLITTKPSFDGNSGSLMAQAGATSRGSTPDYGGSLVGNLVAVPGLLAVRAAVFDNYDEGFLTRTYPSPSGSGTVSAPHDGAIRTYGGSLTALMTVSDRFDVTLRFLSQAQGFDGLREAYAPLPDFTPVYTLNRTTDSPESASNHFGLASLDLQYRGENWTLTSATSYYYYRNHEVENGTEGTDEFFAGYGATLPPTSPIVVSQFTDTSQVTEEVRLAATVSSSLSFITGLYYAHNYQDYGLPDVEAAGLAATGFYPNDQLVVFDARTVNKSSAAFGELYYKFLDKFTLTLGGRYFRLDQQTRSVADGFFVGGPSDSGVEKSSQSGFSPKAALSYAISNDSSVYALFSKGFRPGGPQAPVAGLCLPGLIAEGLPNGAYSADTVENYELGAKSTLLGGRAYVTAAAFQMNWDNIQQSIVLPCGAGIRANTGDGRIRGGELELNGHLVGGLDVRVGLGAESAVITNAGFAAIPSGQRIFQVPRFNGTAGFVYNFDEVSGYQPYLSVDYNYMGDRLSANNSPENTPLVEPSYSVLNARLGVRFGRSELTLYANNATNEKANLGDIQQIAFPQSIRNASGQTVPYLEVGVLPPLQVGVQYRQRF